VKKCTRAVDFPEPVLKIPPHGPNYPPFQAWIDEFPDANMPTGNRPDPSEMGRYLALGQAGMEMVVPIAIGVAIDYYLNCSPWGAVIGTLAGFFGGLAHLLIMLKRLNEKPREPSEREQKERDEKRPDSGAE
jgi:hypothetical protein